jgi:hypothetical protein
MGKIINEIYANFWQSIKVDSTFIRMLISERLSKN